MSYLSDMGIGSEIQLDIKTPKGNITIQNHILGISEYSEKFGYGVCVNPVKINDHLVSLTGYHIEITIMNNTDGRTYKFPLSLAVNNKKTMRLQLYSKFDSKPTNFRDTFRMPCSYQAEVQIAEHNGIVKAFVHDVSLMGISFTFEKDSCKASVGNQISATIIDDKGFRIKLSGEIVRVDHTYSDTRFIVGVKLQETTMDIAKLISKLQINELRVRANR